MYCKKRLDRDSNELRKIEFIPNYAKNADGSCLIKMGETHVLCTATIEDRVPPFIKGSGSGWIVAEYSMIPCATNSRNQREVMKGKQNGRTQEIQRLIGRVLRSTLNLQALGEKQIIIDCDVLQADGGTRTAAINGGYIALHLALRKLWEKRQIRNIPVMRHISAVSCGICAGNMLVDLDYEEDSAADIDANFAISSDTGLIEAQWSAERGIGTVKDLHEMITLAEEACAIIRKKQLEVLGIIPE